MAEHPDDERAESVTGLEPITDETVLDRCRAGTDAVLAEHDPRETFGWDKRDAKARFGDVTDEVSALQQRLYAEGERALLMVLQGIDAGGKGGTIRSVMNQLNPAGVSVHGFGVPSEEERAHDFLWRIHAHTPELGKIAVFDRSHYEDVLVVRVKQLVPESVWRGRFAHIRNFEALLDDEGTTVVKFFLNVSSEEQRERLQDRIDDPEERWKFRAGDLDDRALWDEYQAAFQDAIRETTTDAAPWYVVPGDRKWVRNLVVALALRHHLRLIGPEYPPAEEDIEHIVVT
ncbi:MAG: polyphosphate kinase [Acidimicrobiaceae bacterium]|nr:polyphosphate kinase [Acidimicrobiaceae bacterium]